MCVRHLGEQEQGLDLFRDGGHPTEGSIERFAFSASRPWGRRIPTGLH